MKRHLKGAFFLLTAIFLLGLTGCGYHEHCAEYKPVWTGKDIRDACVRWDCDDGYVRSEPWGPWGFFRGKCVPGIE